MVFCLLCIITLVHSSTHSTIQLLAAHDPTGVTFTNPQRLFFVISLQWLKLRRVVH
jgi:hypothetical protein